MFRIIRRLKQKLFRQGRGAIFFAGRWWDWKEVQQGFL